MDNCPNCGKPIENCKCDSVDMKKIEVDGIESQLEKTIIGLQEMVKDDLDSIPVSNAITEEDEQGFIRPASVRNAMDNEGGQGNFTSFANEVKDFAQNRGGLAGLSSSIEPEFTLLITGLNNMEEQKRLVDELADPLLGLDIENIQKQVHKGRLIIRPIHETIGAIITSRIKDMDCSVYLAPSSEMADLFPQLKNADIESTEVSDSVTVTTGEHIQGKRVVKYISIISVEDVVPSDKIMNDPALVTDIDAQLGDTYVSKALSHLSEKLVDRAKKMGANAVINTRLLMPASFNQKDALFILYGTAVVVA
jgi:uncharacterized protein YbjQ (UPF0145 family)